MQFCKVFDFRKTVHSTQNSGETDEENFSKVVAGVTRGARVLDDFKRMESHGKSTSIIKLVGITRHPTISCCSFSSTRPAV